MLAGGRVSACAVSKHMVQQPANPTVFLRCYVYLCICFDHTNGAASQRRSRPELWWQCGPVLGRCSKAPLQNKLKQEHLKTKSGKKPAMTRHRGQKQTRKHLLGVVNLQQLSLFLGFAFSTEMNSLP